MRAGDCVCECVAVCVFWCGCGHALRGVLSDKMKDLTNTLIMTMMMIKNVYPNSRRQITQIKQLALNVLPYGSWCSF